MLTLLWPRLSALRETISKARLVDALKEIELTEGDTGFMDRRYKEVRQKSARPGHVCLWRWLPALPREAPACCRLLHPRLMLLPPATPTPAAASCSADPGAGRAPEGGCQEVRGPGRLPTGDPEGPLHRLPQAIHRRVYESIQEGIRLARPQPPTGGLVVSSKHLHPRPLPRESPARPSRLCPWTAGSEPSTKLRQLDQLLSGDELALEEIASLFKEPGHGGMGAGGGFSGMGMAGGPGGQARMGLQGF